MKYLLDTNIVIDYFKGKENVVNKIDEILDEGLAISTITLAELYHGAQKSARPKPNLEKIERFIKVPGISPVDFDNNCAWEYGKLLKNLEKKGIKLAEADTMIAATARSYKQIVVTEDKKHFVRLLDFGIRVEAV